MKTSLATRLIFSFLLSSTLVFLSSCGGAPAKEEDIDLVIRISASADVNPDLENRPSPIILHVFELSDLDAFNRVDFFALTQHDAVSLGASLLHKSEIILTPGSSQQSTLKLSPQTAYLGFVGAYRDIDNSSWRTSQAITAGKTGALSVKLDKQKVSIAPIND